MDLSLGYVVNEESEGMMLEWQPLRFDRLWLGLSRTVVTRRNGLVRTQLLSIAVSILQALRHICKRGLVIDLLDRF